ARAPPWPATLASSATLGGGRAGGDDEGGARCERRVGIAHVGDVPEVGDQLVARQAADAGAVARAEVADLGVAGRVVGAERTGAPGSHAAAVRAAPIAAA